MFKGSFPSGYCKVTNDMNKSKKYWALLVFYLIAVLIIITNVET